METIMSSLAWLRDFLARPVASPPSPMTIFLIVGVVLVSVVLWNLVLYHIRSAGSAITEVVT